MPTHATLGEVVDRIVLVLSVVIDDLKTKEVEALRCPGGAYSVFDYIRPHIERAAATSDPLSLRVIQVQIRSIFARIDEYHYDMSTKAGAKSLANDLGPVLTYFAGFKLEGGRLLTQNYNFASEKGYNQFDTVLASYKPYIKSLGQVVKRIVDGFPCFIQELKELLGKKKESAIRLSDELENSRIVILLTTIAYHHPGNGYALLEIFQGYNDAPTHAEIARALVEQKNNILRILKEIQETSTSLLTRYSFDSEEGYSKFNIALPLKCKPAGSFLQTSFLQVSHSSQPQKIHHHAQQVSPQPQKIQDHTDNTLQHFPLLMIGLLFVVFLFGRFVRRM